MSHKIVVSKALEFAEGEELYDFVRKLHEAVAVIRRKENLGYPYLFGIYDGYIITKDSDSGRYYRFDYSRNGEEVVLGEPIEMRMTFTPKDMTAVTKSADGVECGERMIDMSSWLWIGILG